jgi:diguanylate cyclase (GGDEF)-like protein
MRGSRRSSGVSWLIFLLGFGLALAVALVLSEAARRRDVALRLADKRYRELEEARAEAERLSREDAATGTANRRHFNELLARELARREGPAPAVLLVDLDLFKRVNDEHGHLTGDAVLRAAAKRIGSDLRASDCLARWGGEEFAVFAPDTDRAGAARLAERARAALADRPIDVDGIVIPLTASVGGAVADESASTPDTLVEAADRALYEAKRAGRNCVRVTGLEPAAATE